MVKLSDNGQIVTARQLDQIISENIRFGGVSKVCRFGGCTRLTAAQEDTGLEKSLVNIQI